MIKSNSVTSSLEENALISSKEYSRFFFAEDFFVVLFSALGEIVSTGTSVDSSITVAMIENIFYPKAPLHDGAMVIIDNRIHSAGCILPLTQNELSRDLGTRHRAAVGISEVSDALVVVVSEETGKVSVAHKSVLERDVSQGELLEKISAFLISDSGEKLLPISRRRKNRDE